jgi:hypothetical protein
MLRIILILTAAALVLAAALLKGGETKAVNNLGQNNQNP